MYEVASRLSRRGWKVTWYALKSWTGPNDLIVDGIIYCGLDGDTQLYTKSGRRSIREALSFGKAVWRVRRRIGRHSRIWCGQWPYFHIMALLLPCRRRLVVDWWETWGAHWMVYGGRSLGYLGLALERAAAVIFSLCGSLVTVAKTSRDDVVAAGARERSVTVIPNGISCKEIDKVTPASFGSDIVYAGRLKSHKNVDHLIQAVGLIRDRHAIHLSVNIIGDGPDRPRLEETVRSLDLHEQIRFHGELPTQAMLAIVKSAAIFVHPSTKEGGGSITLLEANACGVPVVIYRHPNGIDPSLVIPGVTGFVVDQVSAGALAETIMNCLRDRSRAVVDATACMEFARQYDWDAIAASYDMLLSREPPQ